MNYKQLAPKDLSFWYDFGISDTKLLIHVDNHIRNFLTKELMPETDTEYATKVCEKLEVEQYYSIEHKRWGFGSCFRWISNAKPGWSTIEVSLVPNDFKKKHYQKLFNISATLWELFKTLDLHYGSELLCESKEHLEDQLLFIKNFSTGIGAHSCRFSADVSLKLCKWINNISSKVSSYPIGRISVKKSVNDSMDKVQVIIDTMALIDSKLTKTKKRECNSIKVKFSEKFLFLFCGGNACGICPEDYYDNSLEVGYELIPCNIDSLIQQFILLAGLAKICQLAREDGY